MAAPVEEIDSDIEFVATPKFSVDVREELQGEGWEVDDADDPDRLVKEKEPWPPLHPPGNACAKLRQDTDQSAAAAIEVGDYPRAVDIYTEAMKTGGSNPMMLATRAVLLLKLKRPCAAIRDCTAALKINEHMVKAWRVRGFAHRRLGHWRKAHRDLAEAQKLKYDDDTAEMQKVVNAKKRKAEHRSGNHSRHTDASPPRSPTQYPNLHLTADQQLAAAVAPYEQLQSMQHADMLKDLDKGQAVILVGLLKTPQLNGRRGVVERQDPRPASKGRWEVEVRMDGGFLEIKSLKRENIQTLNKADKAACKAWATAEKAHKEARQKREKQEEQYKYKLCVEAKISKLTVTDRAKDLLRTLSPQEALSVLDRSDDPSVTSVSDFIIAQAKALLGQESDSEDETSKPAEKKAKTD